MSYACSVNRISTELMVTNNGLNGEQNMFFPIHHFPQHCSLCDYNLFPNWMTSSTMEVEVGDESRSLTKYNWFIRTLKDIHYENLVGSLHSWYMVVDKRSLVLFIVEFELIHLVPEHCSQQIQQRSLEGDERRRRSSSSTTRQSSSNWSSGGHYANYIRYELWRKKQQGNVREKDSWESYYGVSIAAWPSKNSPKNSLWFCSRSQTRI